jgi:hypothetical protein
MGARDSECGRCVGFHITWLRPKRLENVYAQLVVAVRHVLRGLFVVLRRRYEKDRDPVKTASLSHTTESMFAAARFCQEGG